MGQILGLGLTHYPPLLGLDKNMADILRLTLNDPGLPKYYRDPANWPEALRVEFGSDGGERSAKSHREELTTNFRKMREALDEFQPDVIVIWGDDQYETSFKHTVKTAQDREWDHHTAILSREIGSTQEISNIPDEVRVFLIWSRFVINYLN